MRWSKARNIPVYVFKRTGSRFIEKRLKDSTEQQSDRQRLLTKQ